jgi:hypothetical protein
MLTNAVDVDGTGECRSRIVNISEVLLPRQHIVYEGGGKKYPTIFRTSK